MEAKGKFSLVRTSEHVHLGSHIKDKSLIICKFGDTIILVAQAVNFMHATAIRTETDKEGDIYEVDFKFTFVIGDFNYDLIYEDMYFSVLFDLKRINWNANELTIIDTRKSSLHFNKITY